MISRQSPQTCQKIILSLAFNEPVLLKMLRFIEKYCEPESLIAIEARTTEHYHEKIHSLALFMLAFKHNLWVSNLDEFVKSQYFDKSDILFLVYLIKPMIANLLRNAAELEQRRKQLTIVDEFVLMAASQLLHLLHEQFARKEYIDPAEWDLHEYDWQSIMQKN